MKKESEYDRARDAYTQIRHKCLAMKLVNDNQEPSAIGRRLDTLRELRSLHLGFRQLIRKELKKGCIFSVSDMSRRLATLESAMRSNNGHTFTEALVSVLRASQVLFEKAEREQAVQRKTGYMKLASHYLYLARIKVQIARLLVAIRS